MKSLTKDAEDKREELQDVYLEEGSGWRGWKWRDVKKKEEMVREDLLMLLDAKSPSEAGPKRWTELVNESLHWKQKP